MKRYENFNFPQNHNKRPRLQTEQQSDNNDIWGDDPEIDEVDRCIEFATQICSQNVTNNDAVNNTLISYENFKPNEIHKNVYTSTQAFLSKPGITSMSNNVVPKEQVPSTSTKNETTQVTELVQKLKLLNAENCKLKEMHDTKNGEIAILRSQLKQVQKSVENEKIQKLQSTEEIEQKWNSKYTSALRDNNILKCDSELKDLEIANLKEKLSEAKKVYNSNRNMTILNEEINLSQVEGPKRSTTVNTINTGAMTNLVKRNKSAQTEERSAVLPQSNKFRYPLLKLIPESVFLQIAQNSEILEKNKEALSVHLLFSDVISLVKYTEAELNSSTSTNIVHNIIVRSTELLQFFSEKLNRINNVDFDINANALEGIIKDDDQMKSVTRQRCIFSGSKWNEKEIGCSVRQCTAVISALCISCDSLYYYLIGHSKLCATESKMFIQKNGCSEKSLQFLDIIQNIIETLTTKAKIQQFHLCQFCGLLVSFLKLFSSLVYKGSVLNDQTRTLFLNTIVLRSFELIQKVVNCLAEYPEIPEKVEVLKGLWEFLGNFSHEYKFVSKFCSLENCLIPKIATETKNCPIGTETANYIIQFFHNSLSCGIPWMYQGAKCSCECLVSVYTLTIHVLYTTLDEYSRNILSFTDEKHQQEKCNAIFRVGLIFLHTLTVRNPDLVVRCSRLFSHYQTIILTIQVLKTHFNFSTIHETALGSLVSQLSCDPQNECRITNKNVNDIYSDCFNTF